MYSIGKVSLLNLLLGLFSCTSESRHIYVYNPRVLHTCHANVCSHLHLCMCNEWLSQMAVIIHDSHCTALVPTFISVSLIATARQTRLPRKCPAAILSLCFLTLLGSLLLRDARIRQGASCHRIFIGNSRPTPCSRSGLYNPYLCVLFVRRVGVLSCL